MRNPIGNILKNSGLALIVTAAMLSLVAGTAVADRLITGKSVKNGSLTGADIKNRTLTGADVKNSTIGSVDLTPEAKAALTGPTGATGAPGTHGPIATTSSAALRLTASTTLDDMPGGLATITSPAGSTMLLINFAAECSVAHIANSDYRSLFVRVLVDGAPTSPGETALCSNSDDYNRHQYTGASVQRAVSVSPGAHTVQMQYRVDGGVTLGRIDDSVLSVITG